MNGKKKFLVSAALTASLATGGAVGAMFGAPTLSSAQTDETAQVEPAPRPANGREHRAAGEHEGRAGRQGPHEHRRVGLEAAAEALGMTPDELKTELRQGKSIAEVAEARNVEVDKVVDAIVAAVTEHAEERANQFVNHKRPPRN